MPPAPEKPVPKSRRRALEKLAELMFFDFAGFGGFD